MLVRKIEEAVNKEIPRLSSQLEQIDNEVKKPITLNKCDSEMLGAIQNKEGETTFNLLSIPRNESVDYIKLDTQIKDIFSLIEKDYKKVELYGMKRGWIHYNTMVITEDTSNNWFGYYDVYEGQQIHVFSIATANILHYAFFDENGDVISKKPLANQSTNVTLDEYITCPNGAVKIVIGGYYTSSNYAPFYLEVKEKSDLMVKKNRIEGLENNNKELAEIEGILSFERESWKQQIINEQLKNDICWKNPSKTYVTFTFDDGNKDISDIQSLFESKNVPCCFAIPPQNLNNSTNSGEMVKEVCKRCVENGGEILSHWHKPLTSSSTIEEYNDILINSKRMLLENGFEVNGIITSGGSGWETVNFKDVIKTIRPYYLYNDQFGRYDNVYQFGQVRKFLVTDNTVNKSNVDKAIKGENIMASSTTNCNKWVSFASHGANDNITIKILEELIDYILALDNVEIVNMYTAFQNCKTTKLEKRLLELENK